MTTYPATYVKCRAIEYDPLTVRFLEERGIKVDPKTKENRDGTLEAIYGTIND